MVGIYTNFGNMFEVEIINNWGNDTFTIKYIGMAGTRLVRRKDLIFTDGSTDLTTDQKLIEANIAWLDKNLPADESIGKDWGYTIVDNTSYVISNWYYAKDLDGCDAGKFQFTITYDYDDGEFTFVELRTDEHEWLVSSEDTEPGQDVYIDMLGEYMSNLDSIFPQSMKVSEV